MHRATRPILIAALAGLPLSGASLAQDSVSNVAGSSDAISAFDLDLQRVRYVVDLSPVRSAWGTPYGVAPVLKASRSIASGFNTQILGGSGVSAGQRTGVTIPSTPFPLWTAPGQGVNPSFNAAPASSVSKTGFTRAFGVAFSDFGLEPGDQTLASSAVGAIVGQDAANPARLYVERTTALISRNDLTESDSSSISMGSIDEGGNVYLRVDDFGASLGFANVRGENALAVSLSERSVTPGSVGSLNFLVNLTGSPTGENGPLSGGTATRFLVNNGTVTLNTPVGIFAPLAPGVLASSNATIALDFRGRVTLGRDASSATVSAAAHLAPGVGGLRGNPTFSVAKDLPGSPTAGVVACLAIAPGSTRADRINVFGLNLPASPGTPPTVAPASAAAATLPSPITGPSGYQANASGQAEFSQYLSQVSFRGPSGQVGVGRTQAGELVLAAVATESSAPVSGREFLAVATRNPGTGAFTWTVAAHPGMPVLDGPSLASGAAEIGALVWQSPASMSSPAVDLLGNVYFVAAWDDARPAGAPGPGSTGPGRKTGLFKAVRNDAGQYTLELLLCTGQVVRGVNSGVDWTITRLTLADADSIASGGFHGGQTLQAQLPGRETTNRASSFAAGGIAVNATIRYERGAQDETYEAMLFVGGRTALAGDANGDGIVNFADLNLVLGAYGSSGGPGDLNGDGSVDFSDLNLVLSNFGESSN